MHSILYIHWNVNPEIVRIGGFALHYYSLCFAAAFVVSYLLLRKIFINENKEKVLLDRLTVFVAVGTLVGARLGHCLFYEFGYFRHHLLEIILPFRFSNGKFELTGYRGLASHGGAIGILLAVFLFCKKYKQSFLWVMDRLVIVVAIAGFFVRLGNLFNSEIIGKPSSLRWHLFLKEWMPLHAILHNCMREFVI